MTEPYSEEEIQTGERYAQSPLTGTLYRVTEWVEVGPDDKIVAISKEAVSDD